MNNSNSQFLQLAIDKAWQYQLLTYPNPAVGATVTLNNQILSVEAHKEAGLPHAEVLALKEAYLTKYPISQLASLNKSSDIHQFLIKNHNDFFKDCEIYVTLEPCNHTGRTPACAILLESIAIKKVYIGMLDPNSEASGGKERLENAGIEVEILNSKESYDLLYPFIKWQEDNFVFFKLAAREDGSVTGGYITTKDSLSMVHNIRTKLDLLVIGGNTVRIDRPTLNTRYAKINKSSDVLIYSRKQDFDRTIPLFNVENRKVNISDQLNLDDNRFVMIEGGYSLLEVIKKECNYLVLFISHKIKFDIKFDFNKLGFSKIYSYMINEYDEIVFLKKD